MASPSRCRSCEAPGLTALFSLGDIPPVNAFLERSQLAQEEAFPLDVMFCSACTLVQLGDIVPPEKLFAHYLHLSSASGSNVRHLEEVATLVRERLGATERTRVLEIGSNDGTMLARLKGKVGAVLGVDPARNLAARAQEAGVETISEFFSPALSEEIVRTRGRFDVVVALNVVAHTPDVIALLRAVAGVLAPGGTFVMEAAYVRDTILHGEFDTVYHEHVYCFSLHALRAAFERAGLAVADVETIPTQGGSLRVYGRRGDENPVPSEAVRRLLAEESAARMTDVAPYLEVAARIERFKIDLRQRVARAKARYGKVVGLGAPARGVVVLNYCGLGPDDLAFVIDDTPLKQGRLVPGVHVPVVSWEAMDGGGPAAFLVLAWGQKDEILGKLRRRVREATVIVPFPELTELSLEPAPA